MKTSRHIMKLDDFLFILMLWVSSFHTMTGFHSTSVFAIPISQMKESFQMIPLSMARLLEEENKTITSIPICLCDHENDCLSSESSSPRILQNEIFVCVFSSLLIQVIELNLVQHIYHVNRIRNSKPDSYTWIIHPVDNQSPHVIRTRLDPSFFTWRRRQWTNISMEGTLMFNDDFVNSTSFQHDFTIPFPIQPAPFFPEILSNPYYWCYISFWISVGGTCACLLGYMLWFLKVWKIKQRCKREIFSNDVNKEVEEARADP
jgi:hypothetical protein